MKKIFAFCLAVFLLVPTVASAENSTNSTLEAKKLREFHDFILSQFFCGPLFFQTKTRSEHSYYSEQCKPSSNPALALVPYEPQFNGFTYLNQSLTGSLLIPSFNGIQKILQSHGDHQNAAMIGQAAMVLKFVKNIYDTSYLNESISNEMMCDAGLIGANLLLFRNQHAVGMGRLAYSLLKAPNTLNSEYKKFLKLKVPNSMCSAEGLEFMRELSLIAVGAVNPYFLHTGNTPALAMILAYKGTHYAYDFGAEYSAQAEFTPTLGLIRSAVLGVIIAAQGPLLYAQQTKYAAMFYFMELVLTSVFAYYDT